MNKPQRYWELTRNSCHESSKTEIWNCCQQLVPWWKLYSRYCLCYGHVAIACFRCMCTRYTRVSINKETHFFIFFLCQQFSRRFNMQYGSWSDTIVRCITWCFHMRSLTILMYVGITILVLLTKVSNFIQYLQGAAFYSVYVHNLRAPL